MPLPNSRLVHVNLPEAVQTWSLSDTCTVERDMQAGTDPGGMPLPPDWQVVASDVLCRYFPRPTGQMDKYIEGPRITALVDTDRLAFFYDIPTGSPQVQVGDRITNLVDRDGRSLRDVPFDVHYSEIHRAYQVVSAEAIS